MITRPEGNTGQQAWEKNYEAYSESKYRFDSEPVEAIARDGQVDKTNRFRGWTAERHSVTLTEVFRDFSQL